MLTGPKEEEEDLHVVSMWLLSDHNQFFIVQKYSAFNTPFLLVNHLMQSLTNIKDTCKDL
jgi:hypothetical protein